MTIFKRLWVGVLAGVFILAVGNTSRVNADELSKESYQSMIN